LQIFRTIKQLVSFYSAILPQSRGVFGEIELDSPYIDFVFAASLIIWLVLQRQFENWFEIAVFLAGQNLRASRHSDKY
jgi:hypothetical protein